MKPHAHFARTLITPAVIGLTAALVGCAGPGPRPDNQLQAAESSIRQAEAADAREFNPVLLNQANSKLADARELMNQKKYREAERLLEQAAVDAQLAGARSETEKARRAVEEINNIIADLRKQLEKE